LNSLPQAKSFVPKSQAKALDSSQRGSKKRNLDSTKSVEPKPKKALESSRLESKKAVVVQKKTVSGTKSVKDELKEREIQKLRRSSVEKLDKLDVKIKSSLSSGSESSSLSAKTPVSKKYPSTEVKVSPKPAPITIPKISKTESTQSRMDKRLRLIQTQMTAIKEAKSKLSLVLELEKDDPSGIDSSLVIEAQRLLRE